MSHTISTNPRLLSEWHEKKNTGLDPKKIKLQSNKKIWWKCSKGHDHEWQAPVYSRNSGANCPFCAGKKASSTYNLSLTDPEVSEFWHPTENGELRPTDVTRGSHLKVFWRCPTNKNHVFLMAVYNRVKGKNCSYCSGQKVHKTTSLLKLYPQIASEWHPTKNGKKLPSDFTAFSKKKVWWKCPKGDDHEWQSTIGNRTYNGQGCPCCVGKKICADNSVELQHPHLISEWHPSKNGKAQLSNYTTKSNKSFWWMCSRKHEWKAPISSRSMGYGCPKCAPQTSRPEVRVFTELKSLFPDILWRHKISGVELDIYIPALNVGIEYDGKHWHSSAKAAKNDKIKNTIIADTGISLIRLREHGLKLMDARDLSVFDIVNSKKTMNELVMRLAEFADEERRHQINSYLSEKWFVNHNDYLEICVSLWRPKNGATLLDKFPKVLEFWDYEENFPATPNDFSIQSHHQVSWKCKKFPSHIWKTRIRNMIRKKGELCPYCNKRRVSAEYNITITHPHIARLFHPTKNGQTKPQELTQGSDKKYFWLIGEKIKFRSVANMVRIGKNLSPHI